MNGVWQLEFCDFFGSDNGFLFDFDFSIEGTSASGSLYEGCTDNTACNFNPTATVDDGSCSGTLDAVGVCGGNCTDDVDMDGICDDVDICVGNNFDVIGQCNGDCTSDINYNGICDDQDVTVWDVISSNDSLLNAMDAAILAVGLDADLSTLASPYYTVFAPIDAAFESSFGDLGYQVLGDSLLENLLMYHIIDNQVYDIEALTFWASYGNFTLYTSQGDSIVVSSVADSTGAVTIMVNNASILFDIETANGVVHLIDEVLTFPIYGCMDEGACNYDSDATEDDGSCLAFNVCGGCEGEDLFVWAVRMLWPATGPGATLIAECVLSRAVL